MDSLLIATGNPGKLRELRALLHDLKVNLLTPRDVNLELAVNEDGRTYAENARKKAMAFAEASRIVTLADDSGLEVDLLAGAPGLHSARYVLRPGATDSDRRAQLLQALQSFPRPWKARFRSAVAVAVPGAGAEHAEGACDGEIIPLERGSGGFGYDPIFVVEGTGRTMAELEMEEKNRLSHRARAVAAAWPILVRLYPSGGA